MQRNSSLERNVVRLRKNIYLQGVSHYNSLDKSSVVALGVHSRAS